MVAKNSPERDPSVLAVVILMSTYELAQKNVAVTARAAFFVWLANHCQFEIQDPRSVDFFCAAIDALRGEGLIGPVNHGGDKILLTDKGRARAQEVHRKLDRRRIVRDAVENN